MQMDKHKELQEEMIGVLTAMSIVSKRLANRLLEMEKGGDEDEKESAFNGNSK